ncbi:MAG: hypothetical protein IAG13_14410 [Deltaproteobacteria bacterium]|nr:hypothetical protein [Nannocystaceae bacterium]
MAQTNYNRSAVHASLHPLAWILACGFVTVSCSSDDGAAADGDSTGSEGSSGDDPSTTVNPSTTTTNPADSSSSGDSSSTQGGSDESSSSTGEPIDCRDLPGVDGPEGNDVNMHPHDAGDADAGRRVFRMETFGNENFWTDVVQLPQGIVAAELTPLQALSLGLSVNIDAVPADLQGIIADELQTDLSPAAAPVLNDPASTLALINLNAVIGVVAVDTNGDDTIDVSAGDKVGVSCALCHGITDGSVLASPEQLGGGGIGVELDGPTPHNLQVGMIFAAADNTRALYPIAQLALDAAGGATIGRAPTGVTEESSEEDLDAYFGNPEFYPVGMFDDQPDGTGAPMHIQPMFEQDLAAPYGSEGAISRLDNFSNLVYTVLLDLRNITTPEGRMFLNVLGEAAGDEIVDDYVQILEDTGVPGAPALTISETGPAGEERTPVGVRVDDQALLDMSAYLDGLTAPIGVAGDDAAIARGRAQFRASCTGCHNVDQDMFVPSMLIDMPDIFPGDDPVLVFERTPPVGVPLNDAINTVDSIFDDKMVVVNATLRGDLRGIALPLLLDLARKPVFLHDDTVDSLEALLDATRGADAPHPFYLDDDSCADNSDMIAFLQSLGGD